MTRGASGTRAGCGCFTLGLAAIRSCLSTMALARRTATRTRVSSSPGSTGTGTARMAVELRVVTLEGEERLHPVRVAARAAIGPLRPHRGAHHRHRVSRHRQCDSHQCRVQRCRAEPIGGLAARTPGRLNNQRVRSLVSALSSLDTRAVISPLEKPARTS